VLAGVKLRVELLVESQLGLREGRRVAILHCEIDVLLKQPQPAS
jgi:hypothetical protein